MAPRGSGEATPLLLHKGKHLTLDSVTVDGAAVATSEPEEGVVAVPVPEGKCIVVTRSTIRPEANTELEGLYRENSAASKNYLTQCEAEGFREISPFIDRCEAGYEEGAALRGCRGGANCSSSFPRSPDNLSVYTVRVAASKTVCPVLLSNGDCADKGDLPDGRHFAVWHDPHPKPSYLFALVAGDLVAREAPFTTKSGRAVTARVWTSAAELPRSAWALESIIRAMRWDEERFGLEYDLDQFNVVATPDFNMGAMGACVCCLLRCFLESVTPCLCLCL